MSPMEKKIGAEWKNDYAGMHSFSILFKIGEDYKNSTRGWEQGMSPIAKLFSGLKGPCKDLKIQSFFYI